MAPWQLPRTTSGSCFSSGFPFCRGEAGLVVTPLYGYFCHFFPLAPVVGIFSPLFFLLCISQISLHIILPSQPWSSSFLQPAWFFVSDLFGNLSSFILTMCPANYTSFSSNFILQVFHSHSLHSIFTPAILLIQLFSHTCSVVYVVAVGQS